MRLSPIALFTYNRLQYLRRVVESLKSNYLAPESELFIFSDGPKDNETRDAVKAVRDYLKTLSGFKKVIIYESESNLGLFRAVTKGVTDVVDRYGKVIVLEDDLLVSPHFLKYMNEALSFYEKEDRVISICGYMYPVKAKSHQTIFLRIPDCWGWATWKRGWDMFEPDANSLLVKLKARNLTKKFNLNGGYDFLNMLKKQAENRISSWAICWYASSLLNDKLSLYPAKSLVRNIGLGELGTHRGYSAGYDVDILQGEVAVSGIPIEENRYMTKKIEIFFRINQLKKLGYLIRDILISSFNKGRHKKS